MFETYASINIVIKLTFVYAKIILNDLRIQTASVTEATHFQ